MLELKVLVQPTSNWYNSLPDSG